METRYTIRHNALMLHDNTLCVTVHQNCHQAHLVHKFNKHEYINNMHYISDIFHVANRLLF